MMTRDWLMRGSLKFMRMVGGCLAGVVAGAQLVAGGSGHVTRALHCMAACCFLQLQCRVEEDSSLSIAEDTSRTLHACMHACVFQSWQSMAASCLALEFSLPATHDSRSAADSGAHSAMQPCRDGQYYYTSLSPHLGRVAVLLFLEEDGNGRTFFFGCRNMVK
jgi:hypothetical protein